MESITNRSFTEFDSLAGRPIRSSSVESNWSLYSRMVGIPSALFVALVSPIHAINCELRTEPTHWQSTILLVLAGLLLCSNTAFARSMQPNLLVIAAIIQVFLLAACFMFGQACEMHLYLAAWLSLLFFTQMVLQFRRSRKSLVSSNHLHLTAAIDGCKEDCESTKTPAIKNSIPESMIEDYECETSSSTHTDHDEINRSSVKGWTSRNAWGRRAVWTLLIGGFLIYMIVVPSLGMVFNAFSVSPVGGHVLTDMTLLETVRLHTVSGVVMLLFLATGASVGSFLNVVIYRLPRKLPLLWPPSACPKCATQIPTRDNIPIISWLSLGGRCRACSSLISVRYPIVEAWVASFFVLFFYRELLSGGVNLADRTPNLYRGIVWILLYTKWDMLITYAYHMLVLTVLFAWGMINVDRLRVPCFAAFSVVATAVAVFAAAPWINHVSYPISGATQNSIAAFLNSLLNAAAGLIAGLVLSRMFTMTAMFYSSKSNSEGSVAQVKNDANLFYESSGLKDLEEKDTAKPDDFQPQFLSIQTNQSELDPYGQSVESNAKISDLVASLALCGAAFGSISLFMIIPLAIALNAFTRFFAVVRKRRNFEESHTSFPMTLYIHFASVVHLMWWSTFHQSLVRPFSFSG